MSNLSAVLSWNTSVMEWSSVSVEKSTSSRVLPFTWGNFIEAAIKVKSKTRKPETRRKRRSISEGTEEFSLTDFRPEKSSQAAKACTTGDGVGQGLVVFPPGYSRLPAFET